MPPPRDARAELEELRRVFREELDDHVTAMEREGLTLARAEVDPEAQRAAIAEIYRAAHSLKGAARAVEHTDVEKLCHALEAHLAPARKAASPLAARRIAEIAEAAAHALRRWVEAPEVPAAGRERILTEAQRQIERSTTLAPPASAQPLTAPSRIVHSSLPAPSQAEAPEASDPLPVLSSGFPLPRGAETVRVPMERLGQLQSASEDLLALSVRDADLSSELAALDEAFLKLRGDLRRAKEALRGSGGASAGGATEATRCIERCLTVLQPLMGWSSERSRRDALAWKAVANGAASIADRARAMRLVPLESLLPALERATFEAGRALGKDVALHLEGGSIELDRRVRDGLREPLLHLVRNAVDHGIEPPHERVKSGKPAGGSIELSAALSGRDLQISLRDDGRGIDHDLVRAAARARGMEPKSKEPGDVLALLFEPGFTTRAAVTEISGRGIGLDVVRTRIAELHGHVEIEAADRPGAGFSITVPLDLSVIRGLVVGVRDARFVIVTTAVARLLRVRPEDTTAVEGRMYLREPAGLTPLAHLDEVLGFARRASSPSDNEPRPCVVIAAGERRAAFSVDALFDERELVVRPLSVRVRRAAFVAGATVLSDSDIALVLDVADLVRLARPGRSAAAELAELPRRRLLVVDDSITTRQLLRSILETAGYEVAVASDGKEAWDRISAGEPFDLVVSDIEMPRMDGLSLLALIRAAARSARLPFVLVTALDSDVERRRALELDASAYVIKSGFDQGSLIDTIEQLV